MQENERVQNPEGRKPARSAAKDPAQGGVVPVGLLSHQSTAGNAAVVQMLRAAGHSWAQPEQRQHGDGSGQGQTGQAAAQPSVQRSAVHDVLRSSGRPLDEATRTDMEGRLGADFSDVRIHDDAAAKASAAEVGARAYTSGSHVVIGDGGADRHTLAHELTHVIQQRTGPVTGTDNGAGLRVSDPSDRFEREAEANATAAMNSPLTSAESVQRAVGGLSSQPAAAGDPAALQRAMSTRDIAEASAGQVAEKAEPPAAAENVAGIVSLAPVVFSEKLSLVEIARKYRTGFDEGVPVSDRFALVIGVNYWDGLKPDQGKLLSAKIKEFQESWDKEENAFPVRVVGFDWHNDKADEANYKEQNIIPYGLIRQRIMGDPEVPSMIQSLKDCGREHVYLHTSDADTESFQTDAGPLFSAAAGPEVAATEESEGREAGPLQNGNLDLFSGGYTGREPAPAPAGKSAKSKGAKASAGSGRGLVLWQAGRVDLIVRDAMALVNSRSVYYPEPNTFVKVLPDYEGLEPGIGFGEGSQEGANLVNSLRDKRTTRNAAGKGGAATERFDSRYAITTDMERIGQNVETGQGGKKKPSVQDMLKQISNLAQSHASQTTWQDRVEETYGLPAGVKKKLGDFVYAEAYEGKDFGNISEEDIEKSFVKMVKSKGNESLKTAVSGIGVENGGPRQLVDMVTKSRKALLTALASAKEVLSGQAS
ncbi:eCIS core domain-containing protein [Streptomyces sp. BE230]|uniref:eCIS core domain-containing protein n=1 Tax=Streptomyces sp. BE230 TaxID=3002526 RepID=UPI002ED05F62|nr:DUF4157 domain-containing protein [Streptomyces sp. BE230]